MPLELGDELASAAVKEIITAKYNDVSVWAEYGKNMLESKLASIVATSDQFDVSAFIRAAQDAIGGIPVSEASTITYTAPAAPEYNDPVAYAAPTAPTYVTGSELAPSMPAAPTYNTSDIVPDVPDAPTYELGGLAPSMPAAPSWQSISYSEPTLRGTIQAIPGPTRYEAGAAPSTDITFTNTAFSDNLLDTLKAKLNAELSGTHTGLGSAEAALFARETARQNAARSAAYTEITTQFSARGFDMPPGALLAKQTEMNNQTALLLSDSSSQIMAESARLAVDYNKAVLAATSQAIDMLGRLHDSKVMRDFEAAKNEVMLDLEGFKAAIQVLAANADLEGKYISTLATANNSIVQMFSAEVGAESARIGALSDLNKAYAANFSAEVQAETARVGALSDYNKSLASQFTAEVQAGVAKVSAFADYNKSLAGQFTAEVQAETARVSALSDYNKSLSGQFTAEIQGAIAATNAPTEVNKALAAAYSAAVQGAAADVSAQGEEARSKAAADEVASRKAMGIADLASKFALSNIDQAIRKYAADLELLKGTASGAMQLIASSFNTVSTTASLGYQAQGQTSYDGDIESKNANRLAVANLKQSPGGF